MVGSQEDWRAAEASAQCRYGRRRPHARWVVAVLALYGALVSIGIIATLVHRAMVSQADRSGTEFSSEDTRALMERPIWKNKAGRDGS
jgi:hypothetical protein